MRISVDRKSSDFLVDASLLYKDSCPELSRFLLQRPLMAKGSPLWKSSLVSGSAAVCPYCHQWLQADNHRVRLRPKRRPSAHVQSILRRKARGKQLSLMQKKLLRRFQTSSSTVMATCQTCHKTSRHKGMSREFIATLSKAHSTPGSAGKNKTPQASNRANMTTPKSAGKDKTPGSTPRSSSSHPPGSGSSSSKKNLKGKNWVVQRLGKILMREEKDDRKGGLKDFLTSL